MIVFVFTNVQMLNDHHGGIGPVSRHPGGMIHLLIYVHFKHDHEVQ